MFMNFQNTLLTQNSKFEVIIKSLIKGINRKISDPAQTNNAQFLNNFSLQVTSIEKTVA